jgi:hypothetical protein
MVIRISLWAMAGETYELFVSAYVLFNICNTYLIIAHSNLMHSERDCSQLTEYHIVHTCDRPTDRPTDRQTDRTNNLDRV